MNKETLYQVVKDIYKSKIFNKSALDFRIMIFNEKFRSLFKKYDNIEERMRNIEKIYSLIDSYLGVSEVEKKLLGEVFTPFELINEILNKLPSEVWTNPNLKWLDPANGIGNFPAVIISRLMDGLKNEIKDEKDRYRHILKNQLFICDISTKNMFIYLNIFDPNHEYDMNYFRGSFLSNVFDSWMKEKEINKFDIIVGNPPFQDKHKGFGKNLYEEFHSKSINLLNRNGVLSFITPPNWFSPNGNFKTEFISYNLIYVNVNECSKHFKVGSEFTYYTIINNTDYNTTEIVSTISKPFFYDLKNFEFLPKILSPASLSIHCKFFNKEIDNLNIERDQSYSQYSKKMKGNISNEKSDIFKYIMYNTSSKKGIKYSSVKSPLLGVKKVLMSQSGYLKPFYDDGEFGVLEHAYFIKVEDKKEGEYIASLLNSKLYRYIIDSYKYSGFISHMIAKNLKYAKIENITDSNIYEYFHLNKEEIDLIEKITK